MEELYLKYLRSQSVSKNKIFFQMMKVYMNDLIRKPNINSICGDMLLPVSAYKWCLNWWNNNSSNQNGYDLNLKAFSIEKIIKNIDIHEDEIYTLISAYYQSGKTFLVILIIIIYLSSGITPVIIVKKSGDVIQLRKRMEEMFHNFVSDMIRDGFSEDELSSYNEILYQSSSEKPSENNAIELSVNGSEPKCIVVLRHYVQVKRLNDVENASKIVLFIDEAHVCGGYKQIDEINFFLHGDKEKGDAVALVDDEVFQLKNKSTKVFLVTATPSNILFSENRLHTDFVYHKANNSTYKGPENVFHKTIKNDKNVVLSIMSDLSRKSVITRKKMNVIDKHPIIILLHFEKKIDAQEGFMRCFYTEDSLLNRTVIESKWFVCTYTGKGIRLWHHSFVKKNSLMINGIVSERQEKEGEFLFPKLEPCELFDWLAHNGGVKKFQRICIIGYDMVVEGISLSTKNEPGWHLTHIAIIGKHDPDYLSQLTYRLAGNHNDDVELTAMMSLANKKKVIKYVALTNYLIDKLLIYKGNGVNAKVKDILRTVEIFGNRIPTKFVSLNKAKDRDFYKVVENPNKNKEEKILKNAEEAIKSFFCFDEERYYDFMISFRNRMHSNVSCETKKLVQPVIHLDEWVKILQDKLGRKSRTYYDKILEIFEENKARYGKIMTKSKLFSKITCSEKEKTKLINTSWIWHQENSGYCEKVEGSEKGLLFKFIDEQWFVKYNN